VRTDENPNRILNLMQILTSGSVASGESEEDIVKSYIENEKKRYLIQAKQSE
jgi:copper homeostasis protein CutC